MASAAASRSGTWLAEACKAVLAFRALALLLTVLWAPSSDAIVLLVVVLGLAGFATYVPLRHWDRVSPAILRHPAYLTVEVALAGLALLLAGTDSPFFLFTLGTAALAGLIYGFPGACLFSGLLIAAYLGVFAARDTIDGLAPTFENLLGKPVLYPTVALSAAAVRRLFERQTLAHATAGEREREAVAERERARLARDMHDSLAKTVHGIALEASALAKRISRNPSSAVDKARTLASDAETAAKEARGLIHGLRADDTGSLAERVRRWSEAWQAEHPGTSVEVETTEVSLPQAAQHEAVQILKEALRNVERHARATQVRVELGPSDDGHVRLAVADDGAGFVELAAVDLADGMHYGLVGMRERAKLVGGVLGVVSEPGRGTTVAAVLPIAATVAGDRN